MTDTRKEPENMTASKIRARRVEQLERYTYSHFDADGSFSDFIQSSIENLHTAGQQHHASQQRKAVEKYILKTAHTTRWADVVGNAEAKEALIAAVETPKIHSDLFAFYGKTHSRGVLLSGPPGCGKTMLAKAVAGELSRIHNKPAEMIAINGPDIQTSYVGQTEKIIRDIFTYAAEYKTANGFPLVIFIDEADAILPCRDRAYNWEISNVSAFLAEMDGLKENGAFVMLATNRPSALDEAILRPGRCDKLIEVKRPSPEDVEHMLYKGLLSVPKQSSDYDIVTEALTVFCSTEPLAYGVALSGAQCKRWSIYMSDLISGAIIAQLLERAKEIAMARDIAAGTRTGISHIDMRKAAQAYRQQLSTSVSEKTIRGVLHNFPTETLEEAAQEEEFKIQPKKGTLQ